MSSDHSTPTTRLDSGLHEFGLAPAFDPTVRTPIPTPRDSNEDFAVMVDANIQTDPGMFSDSTTPESMDTHIPSVEQLTDSDTLRLQHQMLLGRLETIAEQEARHSEGLFSDNDDLRSHLGDIQLSLYSSQADAQPGSPVGNGSLPPVIQDGSHTSQDGERHRDAVRADFSRGTDISANLPTQLTMSREISAGMSMLRDELTEAATVRRVVGDSVVTFLVAPNEPEDDFNVLPYDGPPGDEIEHQKGVKKLAISLEHQEERQRNVEVWADVNSGYLAARSDVATLDSDSTSNESDGSDSDSTVTEYSEIDVLAEHRVLILYACSFDKMMEKLPSSVVRYITSYPSELEGATEVYVVRVPYIIGGYWSIRLFVKTQVAGITRAFTTSPPLAVFQVRAPVDETMRSSARRSEDGNVIDLCSDEDEEPVGDQASKVKRHIDIITREFTSLSLDVHSGEQALVRAQYDGFRHASSLLTQLQEAKNLRARLEEQTKQLADARSVCLFAIEVEQLNGRVQTSQLNVQQVEDLRSQLREEAVRAAAAKTVSAALIIFLPILVNTEQMVTQEAENLRNELLNHEEVEYRAALENPAIDELVRQQIRQAIAAYVATQLRPAYTCPTCRDPVVTKPTKELKAVVNVVDALAQLPMPVNGMIEERPPRRDDGVWDRFFGYV
ncbi:hypothetical protein FOMPIDRAFT_1055452 [Fomitopsis schrenkii]|uniref:Uncharacterized protein n=1 Tax=Fomitopsis schrenkii TaxID=2126942 RepID=S8F4Z7_FOMSC|nr:hypothetical protein FOMPIDRAFT_1055452 [Fomitopsis schrenkii]